MNVFDLQANEFRSRHIGPNKADRKKMLGTIGVSSMNELIEKTVPSAIRIPSVPALPAPQNEYEYLQELKKTAQLNKVFKTYIGQGYYGTITPSVIQRNIFENPGWYTQYTPYQAEISQGRLESLLNFQTVIADLTALPFANASLLDEATAAAEAMSMLFHQVNKSGAPAKPRFFVDTALFPQTIDVLMTRAEPIGVELVFGEYGTAAIDEHFFGAIVQYPDNNGSVNDYRNFISAVHAVNGYVVMATDLLALTLLTAPGELGADVAVGSAQRFGVPVGFGGPHAGFFATKEAFKRIVPGRIIGVSIDTQGNRALRMALQTREQHIKREKATSNICTAQALLANMAAMYAVYHGPERLKAIATRITVLAKTLSDGLNDLGYINGNKHYFDTLKIAVTSAAKIKSIAEANEVNFRYFDEKHLGISIDETTSQKDVLDILYIFAEASGHSGVSLTFSEDDLPDNIPDYAIRKSRYLTHPVFNTHHSESQMMRYIRLLENKDLSLITSMISLGSCTMKLNAATEMMPVSWPEFAHIHPFVPAYQAKGYAHIIDALSEYLCAITGFDACSLQPNSGAQGEYAGLLTIKRYHKAAGDEKRDVVLIPISAHGTNPASAVLAGMKVVVIKSDEEGHIDVADLKEKAAKYKDTLAALMVTYPSTHGVFEESIKEICAIIHNNGGQVYMDGANMNAQCGLTSPGTIGADICHLNLHKTFAIPHGGGGPGMGPICAKAHLAPYLPAHINNYNGTIKEKYSLLPDARGAVSAAPYGSASILLISYAYIKLLGAEGVKAATEYAILNANYMRARLEKYFDILYLGANGTCAHEFIVDLRPFKTSSGVEAEDVAKRLMDYGFHAPTMSFPVAGTIMIEPTESEDKAELDRFCEALISIHHEIKAIESGKISKTDNPLKNAPHTMHTVCADEWKQAYSRQEAAFPLSYITSNKFWPSVSRINNTYGDRNLVCTCEPVESYMEAEKG
ncbi:aminomethyl-transferring glycine dehydrogenase [Agriterribacter sp.]|uniref:aminomethyl-transferring glycine dehydrogenase n=1 Tax=Agriterribacter sp. TaxID=2821509 RepID=UPI002C2ACDE8|nr:aminomethyl-transferring glycine dehydrogenase [Agriterribacter sp.]HRO45523.1 aminomethyl-transferring glycine dehydrogenase [Agriterribacter sp.]HRQ17955.1 aminomethyl-transferring glycine dehydrogenase [Agriterribacter sp.]